MQCVTCGVPFTPVKNSKTCSPECSRQHKSEHERAYRTRHRGPWSDGMITHYRHFPKIDRAVRLLFALTGENHHERSPE